MSREKGKADVCEVKGKCEVCALWSDNAGIWNTVSASSFWRTPATPHSHSSDSSKAFHPQFYTGNQAEN